MENKYVIGGGVSGLVESYYNNCQVIDTQFLGQLNTRFIPGVRLFEYNEKVVSFIKKIFYELKEIVIINQQVIRVGYDYGNYPVRFEANDEFKKAYSLKTRGKEEYEKSFLSSSKNIYYAIKVDNLDCIDTYQFVFQKLLELLKRKNLLIKDKIKAINPVEKSLLCESDHVYQFDDLISTINLNMLLNILCFVKVEQRQYADELRNKLILLPKSFYKLPYYESIYQYVYSIANVITRCSYFKDYRVVETNGEQLDQIIMIDILDKYENLPLQIKDSLNLIEIFGIKLSGRYSQWNHSIKVNQIIEKYE